MNLWRSSFKSKSKKKSKSKVFRHGDFALAFKYMLKQMKNKTSQRVRMVD